MSSLKGFFPTQKLVAEEMVAFANCDGGVILFGVEDKTGEAVGLDYHEIQRVSRELANTANEQVRPTIYIHTDVVVIDGRMVLVVFVPSGRNKPYKDLTGRIWVKQGADKRRVTENSEILGLFQDAGAVHADEMSIPDTSVDDLDIMSIERFFSSVYGKRIADFNVPMDSLLKNLRMIGKRGRVTTAGMLFFGRSPQLHKPTFVIKAVWFWGKDVAGTEYRDSRDIEGTIPEMYEQGMRWLKSCLRMSQSG